jgi:hypothetical protein
MARRTRSRWVRLKYRLAREKDSTYKIEGESLNDTFRAIRLVKSHAGKWRIDPEKFGVMGFRAPASWLPWLSPFGCFELAVSLHASQWSVSIRLSQWGTVTFDTQREPSTVTPCQM